MPSIADMSKTVKLGCIVLIAVLVTAALYLGFYKGLDDLNRKNRLLLQAKLGEVRELEKYEANMPDMVRQIETLKQQLEIQKRIVPDEKEADRFMDLLQGEAAKSGIEIRRWTAKTIATREFYTEVPFEIELDGPYYSLVNFYERIGRLERIINVSGLQLTSLRSGDANKAKRNFQYAPHESVVGFCTATTFFSHEQSAPPAPAAPGARAAAK
jgi:type IV pilus assembly protein PilO